jgi:hypothetical protein
MASDLEPRSLRWMRDADTAELKIFLRKQLDDREFETDAYLHPYGFVVFKLGLIEPGWLSRLHVWPVGQDTADGWRIHNHAWWLYSRVVTGGLTNHCYDIQPVEDRSANLLYTVASSSFTTGESILVSERQHVNCIEKRVERWKENDLYVVDKFAFHDTVTDNSGLTATLVLTELEGIQRPRVVGPPAAGSRVAFKRHPLESQFILELVSQIID